MVLSTKEFVEKYGLMAKKTLGQNFLLDANITDKIMRLSLKEQNISDLIPHIQEFHQDYI